MILQGHALEVLPTLPKESVHCAVTSPPYFGLRSYNCPDVFWPAVTYCPMAGMPEITVPEWTGQLGLESQLEAYVGHLVAVFREVRKALHPTGTVWLNLGDSYAGSGASAGGEARHGGNVGSRAKWTSSGFKRHNPPGGLKPKDLLMVPARVALALQADSWWLRSDIVWDKPNCMPESVEDRCTRSHEFVFQLAKSERYYFDRIAIAEPAVNGERFHGAYGKHGVFGSEAKSRNGRHDDNNTTTTRNKRSVWRINPENFTGSHFAVMPQALITPCVLAGSSEKGVCPECLSPYVRVVEREAIERGVPRTPTGRGDKPYGKVPGSNTRGVPHREIISSSWRPSCSCNAGNPIPATILDPFAGTARVGIVAERHGRRFIGIELSEVYTKMSETALAQAGLFGLEVA